jgi:hypothetical protein
MRAVEWRAVVGRGRIGLLVRPPALGQENPQRAGHSPQFGKRPGLHLVHDLAAMNLEGHFADPQLGRSLWLVRVRSWANPDAEAEAERLPRLSPYARACV